MGTVKLVLDVDSKRIVPDKALERVIRMHDQIKDLQGYGVEKK